MAKKIQYDLLIQKLKINTRAIQASKRRYGYDALFMLDPKDWKEYADEISHITFSWRL